MWKKVLGIPGSCAFWEFEDGRLALTSKSRHPGPNPDWVDVHRRALIDNVGHEFLVPVLRSDTGRPEYVRCDWGFISNILRLTGLILEPKHPSAQDEHILASGYNEMTEGRTSPAWTYRPERDPARNEVTAEIPPHP